MKLPELLRDPPWHSREVVYEIPVVHLELPGSVRWQPGELDAYAVPVKAPVDLNRLISGDPFDEVEKWMANHTPMLLFILTADDAARALHAFNRIPTEKWTLHPNPHRVKQMLAKFRASFDERLKPYVVDEDGKRLRSFPRKRKTDDAEKAERARDGWHLLREDAERIAKQQIDRLESAMASQRTWSRGDFTAFFVEHPFIRHISRRCVWATYDEDGRVGDAFRIAEDGTLADSDDELYALDASPIGIVHPMLLDEDGLARWGEIFADYEIVQPFAQLGRAVFTVTDEERSVDELERFAHRVIQGGRLYGSRRRGWRLHGDGYTLSRMLDSQSLVALSFEPALGSPEVREHRLTKVTLKGSDGWGSLPSLVFSEVVYELQRLCD